MKKNEIKIPVEVVTMGISGSDLKVYCYIAYCIKRKKTASISEICNALKLNAMTIYRSIHILSEMGLIEIIRTAGKMNIYKIVDIEHRETKQKQPRNATQRNKSNQDG